MKYLHTVIRFFRVPRHLIFAAITVVLASILVMTVKAYFTMSYSTDDVAQQVLLQEATLGDGKDVIATASGYALKYPYYMAISHVLPNTTLTVYITNLLLLTIGLLLALFSYIHLRRYAAYSLPLLIVLFIAFTVMHLSGGAAINPNYRNIEIGLSFLAITATLVYLKQGLVRKIARPVLVLAGMLSAALLGIFWFSDPMFIYYTGLPIGLAAILQGAWFYTNKQQRYRALAVLLVLAASYAVYKGLIPFFDIYLEWRVRPTLGGLIGISELLPTLQKAWSAYVALGTGTNLSTLEVMSFGFLRAVAGVSLVTLGVLSSGWLLLHELCTSKRKANIIVLFFAALPFVMLGIFVMSGTIVDDSSKRYLLLLPFTTALTMAIAVHRLQGTLAKTFTYLASSLSVLVCSIGIITACNAIVSKPATLPNHADKQVASLLQQENLAKGYAPSGMSLYYSFITDNDVTVVSTFCNPQNMGILYLLLDQASVDKPAKKTFFLHYPGAISYRCSMEQVVGRLGEPERIVDGPKGIKILIYDRDIGTDIHK
jgi:hypothetical protein